MMALDLNMRIIPLRSLELFATKMGFMAAKLRPWLAATAASILIHCSSRMAFGGSILPGDGFRGCRSQPMRMWSFHTCDRHHRCFQLPTIGLPTRQPTAQYVDFIVLYLQPAHGRMHVIELMELGHFIDELLQQWIGFNWHKCADTFLHAEICWTTISLDQESSSFWFVVA